MTVDSIREEALALPEPDRGRLAADLLASLEPPALVDEASAHEAWIDELTRRAKRALSGEEQGELWSHVERRLRNELTE